MAHRSDVAPPPGSRVSGWRWGRAALWTLLACLPLAACSLTGGPVSGRVLEEGTNKPIAGAIVVVKWKGDLPSFADSKTVCYHVASARSDIAGRFHIPVWVTLPEHGWQARIINREHQIFAYKPGFEWSLKDAPSGEVVLLAPFKGTVAERFQYFNSVVSNTNCGGAGASGRVLHWLWIALHQEAASIAVSASEKQQANILRFDAQSVLVDDSKPTRYNEHGQLVNVDPRDSFKVEALR